MSYLWSVFRHSAECGNYLQFDLSAQRSLHPIVMSEKKTQLVALASKR